MVISRTTVAALLIAMGASALLAAAEPLPGQWERRFTAYLSDPVSGTEKAWAEPAEKRCLSEADLRKLPFLTALAAKTAYEAQGSTCVVADETRTVQTASWNLRCKETDASPVVVQMSTEVSESHIVAVTRTAASDPSPGAGAVRVEVRMARLGACDGAAAKAP